MGYLNLSAQNGNEYALRVLERMSENTFLSITTDILDIVGHLAELESKRPVRDCTTMPITRGKMPVEHEMSM